MEIQGGGFGLPNGPLQELNGGRSNTVRFSPDAGIED